MEINTQTKLCGVLGKPVEHSLSPAIHNAAFQCLGLNFVYLAFPVEDVAGAIQGIRALGNLRGFSVTIPHKVTVLPYLDEIEATANNIGAINTIVVENGHLSGYNTDAAGARRALVDAGIDLTAQRVLMLGSGGAARAIAFALASPSQVERLTILGVDDQERHKLVEDLKSKTSLSLEAGPISQDGLAAAVKEATVLIHCTPVGMFPHVDETAVHKAYLHSQLAVMDIVYNPLETRLLREAREAGCRTIPGLAMFLNQAAAQFELWTERPAPTDVMRTILKSRFS